MVCRALAESYFKDDDDMRIVLKFSLFWKLEFGGPAKVFDDLLPSSTSVFLWIMMILQIANLNLLELLLFLVSESFEFSLSNLLVSTALLLSLL